jgi:hypothetical protein
MDEVKGEWRKVHGVDLHDFYSSPNIIWMINQEEVEGAHVACMGEKRCACKAFVGNPESKRQLGWP